MKRLVFTHFISIWGLVGFIDGAAPSPLYGQKIKAELPPKVESLLRRYRKTTDQLGYWIIELGEEQDVENHQGASSFIPASVLKILTAKYALDVLGPRYRWKTELYLSGPVEQGVLKGDLYLIGKGDPMLQSSDLLDLTYSLKSRGIEKVTGNFIYDASFLPRLERITSMGAQDESYNTGLSGLNSNFNRFLIWRESRATRGRSVKFSPVPYLDTIGFEKTLQSFPIGAALLEKPTPERKGKDGKAPAMEDEKKDSSGQGNRETWLIHKHKRYSKRKRTLPARNPALHTATLFRKLASMIQVELPAPTEGKKPKKAKLLMSHRGPSVSQLAKSILEYSNNTLTEIMMLTAAKQQLGAIKNLEQAASQMKSWYRSLYPSLPWDELSVKNGSGLDSQNFISPRLMAKFLAVAYSTATPPHSLPSLLSWSGHSGWLRKRMARPKYAMRVLAKTGTLDYVSGLAGYFCGKSGKFYAFSLFLNDLEKRKIMDNREHPKYRRTLSKALRWRHRSKSFENALLEYWVDRF